MIPWAFKQRVTGPPLEPVTPTTAPEPPVPFSCPDPVAAGHLTRDQWEQFALALHDRWHGDYNPERAVQCARLSGAFDDAAMAAPLVARWVAEAEQAGMRVLLRAAADADRAHRLGAMQSRDVSPADLAWFKADPQKFLRRLAQAGVPPHELAQWLRSLAGRRPS